MDRPINAAEVRVLFAAGGTGGHVFPALQTAMALQAEAASRGQIARISFLGVGRPSEYYILSNSGFKHEVIPYVGLKSRGLKGLVEFLATLPKNLLATRQILREQRPQVVCGFGGYPSVLPVLYAWASGIPTWIHEAELKPGVATRILAPFVDKISTGFLEAKLPCSSKIERTGHPVRMGIPALESAPIGRTPRNILIVGGSQGAVVLDDTVPLVAAQLGVEGLSIMHQCRRDKEQELQAAYRRQGVNAQVQPFIKDMNAAYQWADLVISRSGAAAVIELGLLNKPVILVPFAHAQGGHQKANALTLVSAGKALLVEEGPDFSTALSTALATLLNPTAYGEMVARPRVMRSADAAREIAKGLLALIPVK